MFEPIKIAKAVKSLNLKHVVITSVDRDDLDDGGSDHFYKVVFGKTLAQYNESKRIEDMTELQKEKDEKRREREKSDEKKEKNAEEVIIN